MAGALKPETELLLAAWRRPLDIERLASAVAAGIAAGLTGKPWPLLCAAKAYLLGSRDADALGRLERAVDVYCAGSIPLADDAARRNAAELARSVGISQRDASPWWAA